MGGGGLIRRYSFPSRNKFAPLSIKIEPVSIQAKESERLLAELWREIDELYGNDAPSTWRLRGMEQSGAAFVIARQDETAVGCAALRPLTSSIAEVKRMFVRREARRAGVARAIMHALEQIAREKGFSEIWLETGLRQPAAIRLYESLGYTRIAGFGDYRDDPLSVCYGKTLI